MQSDDQTWQSFVGQDSEPLPDVMTSCYNAWVWQTPAEAGAAEPAPVDPGAEDLMRYYNSAWPKG